MPPSMFNHGNVRIRLGSTWVLRWIVVTPRCIACIIPRRRARPIAISASTCLGGIGGSAPIRAEPAAGHQNMTIGIEQFRDPRELRLDRMLVEILSRR